MSQRNRLLLWVLLLGLFDAIIPFFPVLALVLVYVLLEKPQWFLDSVKEVYDMT